MTSKKPTVNPEALILPYFSVQLDTDHEYDLRDLEREALKYFNDPKCSPPIESWNVSVTTEYDYGDSHASFSMNFFRRETEVQRSYRVACEKKNLSLWLEKQERRNLSLLEKRRQREEHELQAYLRLKAKFEPLEKETSSEKQEKQETLNGQ